MKQLFSICFKSVLILLCISSYSFAFDPEVKKVLIVHSYCLDNVCGAPQHQGVVESLAAKGFKVGENLSVHDYAMDTKKVNNTPELIRKEADIVLGKIGELKPDAVVLLDDNAFRTVGIDLVDTDVNIVFCGLNGQPEEYDRVKNWLNSRVKPGHNITGVYEKLHIRDAFMVQKMILPDLKKALIISDESPTGKAVMKQVNRELAQDTQGVEFETKIVNTWEDYVKAVKEADADPEVRTIYPAATLLKDNSGITYSTSDIIRWTVANSKTPGIAINYAFARLGMLGGAGVDFISMGRQAGIMVAEILNGTSPGDIPIEDAKRYALVFNLKRAEELGIVIPNDVLMAADAVYK